MTARLAKGISVGDEAFRSVLLRQPALTLVAFPTPHPLEHGIGPGPDYERAVEVSVHMDALPLAASWAAEDGLPFFSEPDRAAIRPGSVIRYVDQSQERRAILRRGRRALTLIRWEYRLPWLAVLWARWKTIRTRQRRVRLSARPLR